MAHGAGSHCSDPMPTTLPFGTNLPSLSQSRGTIFDSSGRDVFSPSALGPIDALHESTGKHLIEQLSNSISLSS